MYHLVARLLHATLENKNTCCTEVVDEMQKIQSKDETANIKNLKWHASLPAILAVMITI